MAITSILKPTLKNLWLKPASTAFGVRPNTMRLQVPYDQYGKNVLERIFLRKVAASNKENKQFLNRLSNLTKVKKAKTGGKYLLSTQDSSPYAGYVPSNVGPQRQKDS